MAPPSISPYIHQGSPPQPPTLTRPLRLGRPPTEEATELTELMEELLGLWVSADTPMAMRLVFLALAGLVDGKPMRITLWIGAKRPNLGGHWKYLEVQERPCCHYRTTAWSPACRPHLFRAQQRQRGSSLGTHHPYPKTNRPDSQKRNRGEQGLLFCTAIGCISGEWGNNN